MTHAPEVLNLTMRLHWATAALAALAAFAARFDAHRLRDAGIGPGRQRSPEPLEEFCCLPLLPFGWRVEVWLANPDNAEIQIEQVRYKETCDGSFSLIIDHFERRFASGCLREPCAANNHPIPGDRYQSDAGTLAVQLFCKRQYVHHK